MRNSGAIWLVMVILLAAGPVRAQSLSGLTENPVIKKSLQEGLIRLKSATAEVNSLPFFEDFSTSDVFPDAAKWEDRDAFVNTSFPVDPPSVGVATLDAIDENGDIYALNNQPVSSDELTSWPFDLSPWASTSDTVWFSFFYQSGGNGEAPELQDSLLLEFYSADEGNWQLAWFAEGDESTEFMHVVLDIPRAFYRDGFQFRFRNYTSMSTGDVQGGRGALSNVDCWNIDYIMMNTGTKASHQSINDVTLVDPPRYLMDFYEIVPWSHLNSAQSITRNTLHYVLRNLEVGGDSLNIGRSYYVKDLNTGMSEYAEQSYGKFAPNTLARRNDPFFAPFVNPGGDEEGLLEVGAYLITPADQFKDNDTARTFLRFRDYYAYDDGVPEYGFGISGEATSGALLACRFRIYKPDTLKAVDIFFNKTRDDYTGGLLFHLCVWKDNGGQPGEMVYISPEAYSPGQEGFLEPVRYNLEQGMAITDSIVYVGWQQLTEDFLNVGYDVNRNSLSKVFVNITGGWFNPGASLIPGSLMIRPVFGSTSVVTGTEEPAGSDADILIHPNPADDVIRITANGFEIKLITILDGLGRPVYSGDHSIADIDVSRFPEGMYFIKLTGNRGETINRKIIISR